MMAQEWRDVVDYEGYYRVSNTGELWNSRFNRPMKKYPRPAGCVVSLSRHGETLFKSLARLVYEAFKHPLRDDEYVTHIDGNSDNNHIDNLRAVARLTEERLREVCASMTAREMADYFNRPVASIRTALYRHNLDYKFEYTWAEEADTLRDLYRDHTSLEIANIYKTSHSNMCNVLNYYGIYKTEVTD